MKLSTQLRNSLTTQLLQLPKRRLEIKTHAKALDKLHRLVSKFERARCSAYVGCLDLFLEQRRERLRPAQQILDLEAVEVGD